MESCLWSFFKQRVWMEIQLLLSATAAVEQCKKFLPSVAYEIQMQTILNSIEATLFDNFRSNAVTQRRKTFAIRSFILLATFLCAFIRFKWIGIARQYDEKSIIFFIESTNIFAPYFLTMRERHSQINWVSRNQI